MGEINDGDTMSVEVFSVEYDGIALERGMMNVRELAPSLLALGDLCQEANSVVNGSSAKVALEVRADFKKGSFDVHLQLVVSAFEQFRTALMGHPKDAKEILEVLGFYAGAATGAIKGVVALTKRLNRGKITETTSLGDGTTRIIVDHVHRLVVDDKTLELFTRSRVAKALEAVTEPLTRDGVEVFQIRNNGKIEEKIEKADVPAFRSIPESLSQDEPLSDTSVPKTYEVVTASKNPDHIWRLSDGESTITVHIKDEEFFSDIISDRMTVSLGDFLRVQIHSITALENGKLKTTNTVTRVISHTPKNSRNDSPPTLPLDAENDEDG